MAALLGGCSSKAAAGGQSAATPGRPAIVAPVYEYVLEKGEPPWWMIEDRRLVLARDPSRILPPLLSEENALLIIREEAQRAGLAFTEEDVALSAVTAEVVLREEQYDWVSETTAQSLCRGTQPIRLALYDPTRRVGIFYAPRPAWGRFPAELDWSGVYNEAYPRETAKTISKKVAEQATDIYFVALYDPSQYVFRPCPWEEVYVGPEESGAAGGGGGWSGIVSREASLMPGLRAECERLFRAQVDGFMDWLKSQGAIQAEARR